MIIVRLLSPERSWLVVSHQSLLGYRSRHCHGINKLIDSVLVNAAQGWRPEAVEHGQLAMVQIRQPKHPATVIRLDSLLAHGDGLPCRRISTTADRLGNASISDRSREF